MTQCLRDLWWKGVEAVRGDTAVQSALPDIANAPDRLIAIGKAACDMARPVMEAHPGIPTLVITKHGHTTALPDPVEIIEAAHPVPDENSLKAGTALARYVAQCGRLDHLMMLVSGGASSVAELLPAGMSLAGWQAETEKMLASGADIHEINRWRRNQSGIKGGKLFERFRGTRLTTLAISDVKGDALDVIGSGIGTPPAQGGFRFVSRIVASNAVARNAIVSAAKSAVIENSERLYGPVEEVAERIGKDLRERPPGLYVFGGEPTVQLPENPGRGGRNQALALLVAQQIAGTKGIDVLVGGTDGTDGPTGDAGGIVNGNTWSARAEEAIAAADTGTFLAENGALFTTGPTGTNVMDILIARKS